MNFARYFTSSLLLVFLLSSNIGLYSQIGVKPFILRGQGFEVAIQTARQNSLKGAIFLVLASDDEEFNGFFIEKAKLQRQQGQEKIYIILADKHPSKPKNECILIAGGKRIETWRQNGSINKDADHYETSAEVLEILSRTYKLYIEKS